jgi:RNA polymerase sigma-70 factor (ECF subfamily)
MSVAPENALAGISCRDEDRDEPRIPIMNNPKRPDVIGLLGPLRRYARSLTRDESQAEDLVQDTLVRAYERHGSFRAGGNLRGWLLSILHNTFIDERRRRQAEARRMERIAEIADTTAPADQESRVRFQQIRQAFLSLPEEQRAALHLVAIEGLSYQEAAAALGIPIGTLMSRLGRGRAALRAFEAGEGPLRITADPSTASTPHPALRIVGGSND